MSYSDYGGLAYKNGVLRLDHCDVTPYKESDPDLYNKYPYFFGTGAWEKEVTPTHVSLGDGLFRVGLYKQTSFYFYYRGHAIDPVSILTEKTRDQVEDCIKSYGNHEPFINFDAFLDNHVAGFYKEGYKIEIFWELSSNYFQFCRLIQPDGNIWYGFSGYHVGNGLEKENEGTTAEQVRRLHKIFSMPYAETISDNPNEITDKIEYLYGDS